MTKEYYQKNKESILKKNREYRERNREVIKDQLKRYWLKSRWGITPEQYNEMLQRQGGLCAICNKPPSPDKKLAVDHSHKTGKIRGLLCFRCNTYLAFVEDDVTGPRCMEYLQSEGWSPNLPIPTAEEIAAKEEAKKKKQRENSRRYKSNHTQEVREAINKWREDNAEYVKSYADHYRATHPEYREKARQRARKWSLEHRKASK